MATLRECHDAIQARLATIEGLRTFNHPPQGGTPPVAFMVLTDWEPTTMGLAGHKAYRINVYVLTAVGVRSVDGYHALLEYADSSGVKSVELAIRNGNVPATGFGGLAYTTAHVAAFRVLGQTEMDAIQMYGGLFTVEIQTKG